ncbi:MAG: hypothetical protein ACR2QF_01570 [Geminicoccaceae bacterium]
MNDPSRKRSGPVLAASLLLCLAVMGCQQYWRNSGIWDIGEHQGLLLDISNYYHRHASEEGGRCRSPILDGINRAEIIEENEEKVWVNIRYHYRDFLKDGDDCDRKWRPLRCTINRECRGYASRTFEAVRGDGGYEVTEMAGPRRR